MRATQLIRRVTDRLHPELGCSDGNCIFGHPSGMATNGGCDCIKERDVYQLKRMLLAMASIARHLATVVPDGIGDKDVEE